ncbi:hypothetical protein DSM112329_03885 [Paraconexibacter sp. AEG42_29]|uniref:DUF4352 domain-containing protein n=1 Tax=Paraconexibacter sp. AEG42_29 TaxID=2997339 RepID=A0AAU7AZV3_9ACTN
MKLRRLALPIIAAAAVTGLSACGDDGPQKVAESEGTSVTIGKLEYQVQISRQLNPTDVEDRDYLQGVPPVQEDLKPEDVWFGIFIRVKNPSDQTLETAEEFTLEDTIDDEYRPIETTSIVGYKPTTLTPGDLFPHSNETSAYGPTQGKLLLFKLTNETLDNRPLELKITAPDGDEGDIRIDV